MLLLRRKWIWFSIVILVALAAITGWKVAQSIEGKDKIVYVYSDTCGYCTSFSPKFDNVVQDFPEWEIERLDVYKQGDYQKAMSLGAEATPTVFLVRDDQVLDKIEGDVSEKAFRKFLEKQLSGPSS